MKIYETIRAYPVISPAGMRRDHTIKGTNVAVPSHESVVEEIMWRLEHRQ